MSDFDSMTTMTITNVALDYLTHIESIIVSFDELFDAIYVWMNIEELIVTSLANRDKYISYALNRNTNNKQSHALTNFSKSKQSIEMLLEILIRANKTLKCS